MKHLLFSLLCLCLLAGCKKEEEPQTHKKNFCPFKCTALPVYISFSDSFSWEEMDTVVLKKYTYGSGFTQLKEYTTYSLADTETYAGLNLFVRTFKDLELTAAYDYEVVIPATGLTYRVSGLVEPEKYIDYYCDEDYTCQEPITEFSVSGGEYELHHLAYHDYPVYIQFNK